MKQIKENFMLLAATNPEAAVIIPTAFVGLVAYLVFKLFN